MEIILRNLLDEPEVVPKPEPPRSTRHAFAFVNIADWVLSCVKIHLWFFNMLLKGFGIGWNTWVAATTKTVLPKWRDGAVQFFQDTFDKDNPVQAYKRPRKGLEHLSDTAPNDSLDSFWCPQCCARTDGHAVFRSKLYRKLRRYRGYQGMLDTTKVPEPELNALRHVIHLSCDALEEGFSAGRDTFDSFTAIADTGCSMTCTNGLKDFLPGTMEELPKPITLGGIAGGLLVKYSGTVSWETVDDFGNIVSLQTKAFLQEDLPCRLFSPQAFLKHSSQRVEDHFRVYSDRAEIYRMESRS